MLPPKDRSAVTINDSNLSPEQIQAHIKRLTLVAFSLYARGSFETAFDTLMTAYLLDPVSPEVMECEKTLLPAWELLQIKKAEEKASSMHSTPDQHVRRSESARIDVLKKEKENERAEKERALWREASLPRKGLGNPPLLRSRQSPVIPRVRFGRVIG